MASIQVIKPPVSQNREELNKNNQKWLESKPLLEKSDFGPETDRRH